MRTILTLGLAFLTGMGCASDQPPATNGPGPVDDPEEILEVNVTNSPEFRNGQPEVAVNPRNPDFIMMAKSFGCHTAQPDSLEVFQEALAAAFTAAAPTLIEVRQDAPYLGGGSA